MCSTKKKVSIFVDGSNMFFAQKGKEFFINWEKFLSFISGKFGEIHEAYYYVGKRKNPKESDIRYINMLSRIGFIIRQKDIKQIKDEDNDRIVHKANLDIEIAIDMVNTKNNYNVGVLCSGDSDFLRLVELLRDSGKTMVIVSTKGFVSSELRYAVGRHYIDFTEYSEIKRDRNK